MIVRSISQLPQITSDLSNGCIEMSMHQSNGKYISQKAQYSDILEDIQQTTTEDIVQTYHLTDSGGNPINVNGLSTLVNRIANQSFTFNEIKSFNNWPCIPKEADGVSIENLATSIYGDNLKYVVPNIGVVKQLVEDNVIFMSTTSSLVAEGNPMPHHQSQATHAAVPESLDYANTIGSGKFYCWQIDNGQNDSSTKIYDPDSGSTDGYEEMKDTGNLVVWGWLADDPLRPPGAEYCWVALYAAMKCEGLDTTQTIDVPISVKPWIRGQYASTLQYISFNVPVKKGLRLKVKTGFPVFDNGGGFQNTGTMTFIDQWVPNAFFGYVIK